MCLVSVSSADDIKSFESGDHSYTVQYPRDWYLESLLGKFYIENFPPSRAVRGVRLPPRGAGIAITAPSDVRGLEQTPRDLDDWVRISTAHQKIASRRSFTIPRADGQQFIVEIRAKCCAARPFLEYVEWYFQIDDHLFSASLVYWEGDPNSYKLLQILQQVALSLRVNDR
jgi:hypothetical protein